MGGCDKLVGLVTPLACKKNIFTDLKKNPISEFQAPKILHEIERILRYRLGEEIAIPIFLVDEKNELLTSLIKKADEVTKLKGDLLNDLTGLVDVLSALPKS